MVINSTKIKIQTKGKDDVLDITSQVREFVSAAKIRNGLVTVFVSGSTASVTTIEYEPALVKDIKNLNEKLVPSNVSYAHDDTWGDANGYAHLRASLIGPSLTIPIVEGELTLGTWQQVIVIDHDRCPRFREIILQVIGE